MLPPEELEKLAQIGKDARNEFESIADATADLVKSLADAGKEAKALEIVSVEIGNTLNKQLANRTKNLQAQFRAGILNRDEIKSEVDKIKAKQASNKQSDISNRFQEMYRSSLIKTNELEKQRIQNIKRSGMGIHELTEEIKKQEKAEANMARAQKASAIINNISGHVSGADKMSAGKAEGMMGSAAGGAGAAIGAIWGPAGAEIGQAVGGMLTSVLSVVLGTVTKFRNDAAGIAKAMAQSGDFDTGVANIKKTGDAFLELEGSQGTGGIEGVGISAKNLSGKMKELAGSGIKLNNTIGENINLTTNMLALSNNVGMGIGEFGQVLTKLRRTTKDSSDAVKTGIKLANTANTLAKADIMQTGEFISMMSGMSDTWAEFNVTADKTRNFIRDLTLNGVQKLGMSAKTAKDITLQLANSFSATSDEWKAFMGQRQGAGGGFVGGLFSAEQRGAGGSVLDRKLDPKEYLRGVMKTIGGLTAGYSGQNKAYMAQQYGKQFGLDAKSTEALMRGILGGTKDQEKSLDEMVKLSEKAESQARPWAEQMADLLQKYVTRPLAAIARLFGYIEDSDNPVADAAEGTGTMIGGGAGLAAGLLGAGALVSATGVALPVGATMMGAGAVLGMMGGANLGGAPGRAMRSSGNSTAKKTTPGFEFGTNGNPIAQDTLAYLHQGEEVLNKKQALAYKQSGAGRGVNLNVTINFQGDLKKAFDAAFQKSLKAYAGAQESAFGQTVVGI